eukprot:CAMPEP_0118892190 /NCGR_PEP_ID=MMETSP1166-20130328/1890_1 /TAXON_ID=1104430 /ORGANISM="Chrysoreinhardia sp, Strain CCMP3193" /LENGTH=128 /DNA_ID=CAMNT_0006830891 /DNA_START=659 /DNA_END=1045 /DNA_ORIENTATION=-
MSMRSTRTSQRRRIHHQHTGVRRVSHTVEVRVLVLEERQDCRSENCVAVFTMLSTAGYYHQVAVRPRPGPTELTFFRNPPQALFKCRSHGHTSDRYAEFMQIKSTADRTQIAKAAAGTCLEQKSSCFA